MSNVHDIHSSARPTEVRVTHLDLDLTLDFAHGRARGSAALDCERLDPTAPLCLDTQDLDIAAVIAADGKPLPYTLGERDPILGRELRIELPTGVSRAVVHYQTTAQGSAMQWLQPSQTAGKRHPFLFTQGQAILTRSWIPLQDSPGVRITWTARIHAPDGLVPLMSARSRDGERFVMDLPVPSYLIALACGELVHRDISDRCAVWAEPCVLDAAAREFEDMEQMVATCEQLFGPYRWGRYDLLVLPPSFPFGGMENPCLTFATPTVLAGDKSLVSLVAHELAHSWSGNLVTNATWRDFWLNEGFTVFLEHRIMEQLYGKARATMEIALSMQNLRDEMAHMEPRDQVLHIDLAGRNPDDGCTLVPYQKGAALLRRLEQLFGRERFDAFLRRHFDQHAFQSITTVEFTAFLQRELLAQDTRLDLPLWLEGPGLPADAPEPHSDLFAQVDGIRAGFLQHRDADSLRQSTTGFVTQQWLHFLDGLPPDVDAATLAQLDAALHFTSSGNSEIATVWLVRCVLADYQPAQARLREFLTSVGRRKFLKPLYEALQRTAAGKALAMAIYRQARPGYHPVSVRTLDALLGWQAGN